jgi:hypothetical protein
MAKVVMTDYFKQRALLEVDGSMRVEGDFYKNSAIVKINGDLWVRGEVYKNRNLQVTGTVYCTNFYGNGGYANVEYSGEQYHNSERFKVTKVAKDWNPLGLYLGEKVIYTPSVLGSAIEREEEAERVRLSGLSASQRRKEGEFGFQLRLICSSGVFICCTCGLSTLYFVVTGVQFWATEFLLKVVGAPYSECLGAFAGTSASAPVLGVVLGGIIVDKIGGK